MADDLPDAMPPTQARPLLHRIDLTGRMVVKRSHEAPIGF
jgi:hypothetical protein